MGVDEDVGVDGGEQQAGHERQQQGVSQVLQVHVEDGQHQAQRLVQLLCLAPLQHFLLGWWREGGKKGVEIYCGSPSVRLCAGSNSLNHHLVAKFKTGHPELCPCQAGSNDKRASVARMPAM